MAEFGNVPEGTTDSVREAIEAARQAAAVTDTEVARKLAYRIVLSTLMRDRAEGRGLGEQDTADLTDIVRTAGAVSENDDQAALTFELVLSGLMQDWLLNWNTEATDEDDGVSPAQR